MPNIRFLKILGKNSICAKPEFHKILGGGLRFIRKLTATKPRFFFSSAQSTHLENPWKTVLAQSQNSTKILGVVGLGFIRKLTTTKPRVFFQVPNIRFLKSVGKSSICAKPELHKILGVGLGFIRKLTTTKPRVFPSAQHTLLENPWAKTVFAQSQNSTKSQGLA